MNENLQKDSMFNNKKFIDWHQKWKKRLEENNNSLEESLKIMRSANPLVIPRNHKVEEVLEAASKNDLNPFHDFLKVLEKPYENQTKTNNYQSSAALSEEKYQTFCGT